MRLIEVSANKDSFHKVKFKNGLNLILGKKKDSGSKDLKKTYNGVGKSLLIQIIHFCLASEPNSQFEEKLPDWEFTLKFEVDGGNYISTRSCKDQRKILLNDTQVTIEEFREKLGREVFYLEEDKKFLTFRSLISRFIRQSVESYISCQKYINSEKEIQNLVNNGYLLGLDVDMILKKFELKTDLDNNDDLRKGLERDDIFRKYFGKDDNSNIELAALNKKVVELKTKLSEFKVAENYYKIERDANDIKQRLQIIRNRIILLKNSLDYINRSLELKADVDIALVKRLYEEANIIIPSAVAKKIDEVLNFHGKITDGRIKRLMDEKAKIQRDLDPREKTKESLSQSLDEKMEFLGAHGALDEYLALSRELNELKNQARKLQDYKDLLNQYKNRHESLKIQFSEENIKTNDYLKKASPVIEKNINLFREFSREFYDNRPGGVEITNNEGFNQRRFNIGVRIEDDASDGVNEVKIFCFDLTLLLASYNHKAHFLIHDSRLYSNMDPRQRATLFNLAKRYSEKNDAQYIATINEDLITPIAPYYSTDEYKNIFGDNIVLELTDESEKSKLLGIEIDMDYNL